MAFIRSPVNTANYPEQQTPTVNTESVLPKQETTETSEKSSGTTSQENINPAETTSQGNIDLAVQLNVGPSPSAEDTLLLLLLL